MLELNEVAPNAAGAAKQLKLVQEKCLLNYIHKNEKVLKKALSESQKKFYEEIE